MEEVADAMPTVGSHDLEPLRADMGTDDVSHFSIPHPRLHRINRLLKRLQQKYPCPSLCSLDFAFCMRHSLS